MDSLHSIQQQQQQPLYSEESSSSSSLVRLLEDSSSDDSSSGDVWTIVLTNLLLFGLIFGLSATVQVRQLKHQLTNKFALATGVAMQFLIMPILGFLSVVSFRSSGLTQPMGIALLVVTASPGGSFSNWWCSTFNAELALSVAMTSVSSILSLGLLPANLFLYAYLAYGTQEEQSIVQALDFESIFITLGVVLAAIVLGLTASYHMDRPQFHIWANRVGTIAGILLILFSVFVSMGGGGDDESASASDLNWAFYLATALPCCLGIALANLLSRSLKLSKPETVAISIECCYQNTGIGTSVAVTMFDGEDRTLAVAVPLFYGIVEAVVICIYCLWAWKADWTKASAEERFCTVVSKSYEIVHDETDPSASDQQDDDDDAKSEDNSPTVTTMTPPPKERRSRISSEDHTVSSCATESVQGTPMDPRKMNRIEEEAHNPDVEQPLVDLTQDELSLEQLPELQWRTYRTQKL